MDDKKVTIRYGQKVVVTIKRVKIKNGHPVMDGPFHQVEEIIVEGTVSGVFENDWCSVYDNKGSHAVIDLR